LPNPSKIGVPDSWCARWPALGFVAPFAVFVSVMAVEHAAGLPLHWTYPVRVALTLIALLLFSRPFLDMKCRAPLGSIVLGAAVFAIWVAPDLLFGYRGHWLFTNRLLGEAASSAPAALKSNYWFIAVRALSCTLLVPVVEELFWRGWLMRWLVGPPLLQVPLGTYTRLAFWGTALLFASEHGSYWEVGLAAGILYNWWVIRTRSLADCILAHAVTNGLLSVYVLAFDAWQYWL
jgi:uncharacterized protein